MVFVHKQTICFSNLHQTKCKRKEKDKMSQHSHNLWSLLVMVFLVKLLVFDNVNICYFQVRKRCITKENFILHWKILLFATFERQLITLEHLKENVIRKTQHQSFNLIHAINVTKASLWQRTYLGNLISFSSHTSSLASQLKLEDYYSTVLLYSIGTINNSDIYILVQNMVKKLFMTILTDERHCVEKKLEKQFREMNGVIFFPSYTSICNF